MSHKTDALHYQFKSRSLWALLLLILVASFYIRAQGTRFGFPLLTHPDEFYIVDAARHIIATQNPDPHFFNYPSFYIYLQTALYSGFYLLNKLVFDVSQFKELDITQLYYIGRLFTVLLSTLTIGLAFYVAKLAHSAKAGIVAAMVLAFSSLHIGNSYFITVDSPMAFGALAAVCCSFWLYLKGPKTYLYILNGLVIGLAIGTKYTAMWSAGCLVLAHFWLFREGKTTLVHKNILYGLLAVPIAFFLTTPYAIFNAVAFIKALVFESRHYRAGHQGMESPVSYGYYYRKLLSNLGLIPLVMGVMGWIVLVLRKKALGTLLITFPLVYFLFMGSYRVHFERNMVAILPYLAIGSGILTATIWDRLVNSQKNRIVHFSCAVVLFAAVLGLSVNMQQQYLLAADIIRINNLPDTRIPAKAWIEANIPTSARIGREHYTPELGRPYNQVKYLGICGLLKADISSLDYIVTSSGDYGRFFKRDSSFTDEAKIYRSFFDRHKLLREFEPDRVHSAGYTIRIYQTIWADPDRSQEPKSTE